MSAVRRYRFTALVTFDPVSRPGAASGTTACYVVEPCHRRYFPAGIALREAKLPVPPAVRAVVSIALVDGEDVAFFAPGQRFTIWADAIVGQAIRAHGRVGFGVIIGRISPPRPRADHDVLGTAVGRVRGHRVATVTASHGRSGATAGDPGVERHGQEEATFGAEAKAHRGSPVTI
jgi:hypothetical protein